tara:strand:+ start:320 stop:475 length:156 start_codon:yes stop_codon:yes gene_type:complete
MRDSWAECPAVSSFILALSERAQRASPRAEGASQPPAGRVAFMQHAIYCML